MPELVFPRLQPKPVKKTTSRNCAGHRNWVRRHACCVRGCRRTPIECAHVRSGTDGGIGLKPSDKWVISLCEFHHTQQHQMGERAFEQEHSLQLSELALEFAKRSPFWPKLAQL